MTSFGYQPSLNSGFFPPRRIRNAWLERDDQVVLRDACKLFDVTMPALLGECRAHQIVRARRYAARRLIDQLGLSFPRAGKILNRHHSTILNLYRPKCLRGKPQ